MQFGFVMGLMGGFFSWLVLHGYIALNPAMTLVKGLVTLLAFVMFILTVSVTIGSIARRKAVFSPTKDGFIYGFTVAFDILYILTQLYLGKLPLP
jgi:hypothetical protein